MKVLVLSDSHRSRTGMYAAVDSIQPDHAIHLGDLMEDAEALVDAYPQLPVCFVPGNCDGWTTKPSIKRITLGGKDILLSHGHLWQVKQGYDVAIDKARTANVDILLFGHTHQAFCRQLEDGLWVLNPGSSRDSYGLIEITGDTVTCSIHSVPGI